MDNKELIQIINEEINGYDFLNMEKLREDENYLETIKSKDFQVKLINDLSQRNNPPTISDWKSDYSHSNANSIDLGYDRDGYKSNGVSFEYNADFIYNYNGKKIPLQISFEGKNLGFKTDLVPSRSASYSSPAEGPTIQDVDYGNANITLFDGEGEQIDISWVNSNPKIKNTIMYSFFGSYPDF